MDGLTDLDAWLDKIRAWPPTETAPSKLFCSHRVYRYIRHRAEDDEVEQQFRWLRPPGSQVGSLPVQVDRAMPPGSWSLVMPDGRVLAEGVLDGGDV